SGLQCLVDLLVEGRLIAGRVGVPDLIIARGCGLAERLDLAERDLGERHRALVFVGLRGHRPSPCATVLAARVAATVFDGYESPVNLAAAAPRNSAVTAMCQREKR